jgi:hypothetical protein
MENWAYTEELRSHLRRGAGNRYAGRDHGAGRDIARMLSPWRRSPRVGGPDAVERHG